MLTMPKNPVAHHLAQRSTGVKAIRRGRPAGDYGVHHRPRRLSAEGTLLRRTDSHVRAEAMSWLALDLMPPIAQRLLVRQV